MSSKVLIVQQRGPILELILNRPDRMNALNEELLNELLQALEAGKDDKSVHIIVISGAGRTFCSGRDIKTMEVADPVEVHREIGVLNNCILLMKSIEKPILAAVHGYAAGAGFSLALACDLIIASEDSHFMMSFAKVGLASDGGGTFFLPQLVGLHLAKELFLLADELSAKQAYDLGIINRLTPVNELSDEVDKIAQHLAAGPTKAFGMMKQLLDHSLDSTLAEVLEKERLTQSMLSTTDDYKEGVHSFLEKRPPSFHRERNLIT